MAPTLQWNTWTTEKKSQDWWKELSAEEDGGDVWVEIGGSLTEAQARHLYSQWFLGRGWATPPVDQEALPKPYWRQVLRWKAGKDDFSPDETTWLELEGEEAIRRIWMLQGHWDKEDSLPNPPTCPFPGFTIHRVTRETPLPALHDDPFQVAVHYWQDKVEEETIDAKEPEWNWIEKASEIHMEWIQEYVFPFHIQPTVELRLREVRSGTADTFWVHHRKGPFFTQSPTRKLWIHIPWNVADGQNTTPNSRGRKSRTLVDPAQLHWNTDSILTDLSTWITSLLQDLHGTYILSSQQDQDAIHKDVPTDAITKTPRPVPLTRASYHDEKTTNHLEEWVAQEDIKGQEGFLWVSRVPGQQEMVWWFGLNKEPISLGWMAEGWAGTLMEGVLVGNQQTLYLRDTLFYKGTDVRSLPFQSIVIESKASLPSQKKGGARRRTYRQKGGMPADQLTQRWEGVMELLKDLNKKGSGWHNLQGLDPEWRILFKPNPTLVAAKVAWEGLPEEEKKADQEPGAWFVGQWLRTLEKESGKKRPTGLAPGPLTAGQRQGLLWRSASASQSSIADRPRYWHFPSMMRLTTRINLVKDENEMPVVKQTERFVTQGVMGKGGSAIEYQPYVLAQLEYQNEKGEFEVWRPRGAPAPSGTGAPAGNGNTPNKGGPFQVAIPIVSGVMASYDPSGARGDVLRDGDMVLWELEQWPELDPNLFPWRPVARMPKDTPSLATEDQIQASWEQFRAPLTEEDWKEGRIPPNEPLPVPLPGADSIPTGKSMLDTTATVGEQEAQTELLDDVNAAEPVEEQREEYYIKREGTGSKLPWKYFHNQIVKRELYRDVAPAWADLIESSPEDEPLLSIRRPPRLEPQGVLLELASGEAHDYTKWGEGAFQHVIGIEKYEVAVERSYEIIRSFDSTYRGYKPRCDFVWGDMTRLIFPDRDAAEDETAKERMSELLPSKYLADVVSVQFALHYAAGNELDLRTVLLNVSDNLQLGGYFMATFFDAERVHALLKANKGKAVGIRKGGSGEEEWSWQIQRKYQPAKWGKTKLNLGNAIEVFVSSIGHAHEEYLLPMETLTQFANEVGLELVKQEGFESYWMRVPQKNKHYKTIREMSDAEKTFSFLNQAVIFQKTKQAPDSAYQEVRKLEKKDKRRQEREKEKAQQKEEEEEEEGRKVEGDATQMKEIMIEEKATTNNIKEEEPKKKKQQQPKKETVKNKNKNKNQKKVMKDTNQEEAMEYRVEKEDS